jgi:hypothetical protein
MSKKCSISLDAYTRIVVQTKLQFQAILDQVFPEFRGVFGDLYSVVSLQTLLEYPTSNDVLVAGEETLAAKIKELCKSRSYKWAETRAKKLISAAERNPFQETLYQSHILRKKPNFSVFKLSDIIPFV